MNRNKNSYRKNSGISEPSTILKGGKSSLHQWLGDTVTLEIKQRTHLNRYKANESPMSTDNISAWESHTQNDSTPTIF